MATVTSPIKLDLFLEQLLMILVCSDSSAVGFLRQRVAVTRSRILWACDASRSMPHQSRQPQQQHQQHQHVTEVQGSETGASAYLLG